MLRAISSSSWGGFREPELLEFRAVLRAWKDSAVLFVDPRDSILREKSIRELSDKARPVIVYCSDEDCDDGKIVAKGLLALGHSQVSVYAGGWEEWAASGSPTEK